MKPGTWRAVLDEHRRPLHTSSGWAASQRCRSRESRSGSSGGAANSDARWLLKLEIAIMCPAMVDCTGLYQELHLC